jgi:hypothetical protein
MRKEIESRSDCPTVAFARFVPRTRDSDPCPAWRCRLVRGHRCPEPPLASARGRGPGCQPFGWGTGSAHFWPPNDDLAEHKLGAAGISALSSAELHLPRSRRAEHPMSAGRVTANVAQDLLERTPSATGGNSLKERTDQVTRSSTHVHKSRWLRVAWRPSFLSATR